MTTDTADRKRRRWIKIIGVAAIGAPLGQFAVQRAAWAEDLISESDPAAQALKYKADATKSSDRKDPTAFCDNCTYYTAKSAGASGACVPLGNRLVAAKGWCTSWEGY